MEQNEIKQLLEENEQLRAELANEKQHISALKEMRKRQSKQARDTPSSKRNPAYQVVHFKEISRYKTPSGEPIKDIFLLLIETPWPADLAYDTVKKLWNEEAETILAKFGYEAYYPDGRHVTLRDRFLPKSHPAIDSLAFYDSISYRAGRYYMISIYAGSAPKIFPGTS